MSIGAILLVFHGVDLGVGSCPCRPGLSESVRLRFFRPSEPNAHFSCQNTRFTLLFDKVLPVSSCLKLRHILCKGDPSLLSHLRDFVVVSSDFGDLMPRECSKIVFVRLVLLETGLENPYAVSH